VLRLTSLFLFTISLNIYGDIILSSPKISLNAKDQRVIEFKITNEIIKDGDIVLYEYKTDSLINKDLVAYTLLESFERYQSYKIVLSETYAEDYFSFKIAIDEDFTKDIFIFLPSKLRNFYEEPQKKEYQSKPVIKPDDIEPIINKVDEQPLINISPLIFKGSEITTVWSMAEQIKNQNKEQISIYQIMWSIYLGNKDAFLDNNINLIRKDLDVVVPPMADMQNISYQFAKDSILKMNISFAENFSTATRSLLVLTAPKVIEEIEQIKEIEPFKDEEAMTFVNDSSNPKDIIEQNTRQVSLGIENETVKELVDIVEEIDSEKNDNFELFDLIFISLISLASGGLLALIFIQLRNMKSSKTLEYDFDEAKDDKSMLSSIPQGLSIENNKDQQQFDLAVTYFEMNDQENAEKILADLIRVSKSNEIKTAATNLLKKLS
tara:strand:- start:5000 stop:6307 length:1308 start_codon:yes stop_codon:yes gene_type:complete